MVLLLPLLAAGVVFVEYFSNLRTKLLAMNCDDISCRVLITSSSIDAQNTQFNDWHERHKDERSKGIYTYDIYFDSKYEPSSFIKMGQHVTFTGEIVSVSDKVLGVTQEKIDKFNYFKQLEGKMTAIELAFHLNNINSCGAMTFTDNEKTIKLSCHGIDMVVNLRGDDFDYFKKLKENIFITEEKVLKDILINRLIGYSLPLLLFLAFSLVAFIILKSYRFVKAG